MLVRSSEFEERHLESSDAWTWSSDLQHPEDSLVPVPAGASQSQLASLLVRAEFTTALGHSLRGLLISAGEVFAVTVLIGRTSFTFNKFAADLSLPELEALASQLDCDPEGLMPFSYVPASGWNLQPGLFDFV